MPIQIISDNKALDLCLSHLTQTDVIAIDLEFDKNLYRYGFNLCLMQLYADKKCFLIDPLSTDLDIKRVFPVIESEHIQKIAFAFGEDIRLLHSLGCDPKNIFDIDIAAKLLNFPPQSLADLARELLNIELSKASQQSNWYKRPLSKQQITYAADDVLYLIDLKKILAQKAAQKKITHWIAEENRAWDRKNGTLQDDHLFKEKDKKDLSEHEWHLFTKLLEFREKLAKKLNKPAFQILKKETIYEIARDPKKLENWHNAAGTYRAVKTEEMKTRLKVLLQKEAQEASRQGLSKSEPAYKAPEKEEIAARKKEKAHIDRLKTAFFNPIKERITEDYGEHTATFMLSNRIVANIITGKNGKLETYKRDLLMTYAEELELDVNGVFSGYQDQDQPFR